ncbi:hypothetical protein [Bernardetia sp.]|uniref:hypothetical protein n=1 Tax=Bernardetia sp. TaxID=1937974 RepID=UPI0025BE48C1|nr:hypothetical protein [Bernardetia sp.]
MTNKLFQSLLVVATLFFAGISTSFAQDVPEESVSYGAFTLYGNFPLGDEFSDQAKFGGGLGFEGAYFFHPLVGFAYSVDAQLNPYNKERNGLNDFTNIDAQPWVHGNLMGGIELSYPITPVIAPEFRALGGLMIARRPEVTYSTVLGSTSAEAITSPAFAYSISGGLKFTNYDGGSAFRVGVRYLSGQPTFGDDDTITFGDNQINLANAQLYVSFGFLSRK